MSYANSSVAGGLNLCIQGMYLTQSVQSFTGGVPLVKDKNIKVLASGQNIDKPKNDREVERSIKAVTLQVTPEQAEKLALASSEGKLQLVMRNSVDQADEQTSGANKRSLLNGERATLVPDPGINGTTATAPKAAPSSSRRSPTGCGATSVSTPVERR